MRGTGGEIFINFNIPSYLIIREELRSLEVGE
jgi:hypothetical protein